jgi:hypothetical protein
MQLGGELIAFLDRGTAQATLGTVGGTPALTIHDARGKSRVHLGAAENCFGLTLRNAKQTSKVQIALDHEGNRLISQ